MEKILIGSAYIYPVCPISIDHCRMYVVGDIISRYNKLVCNNEVFFPIASHYSGNTAHKISNIIKKYTLNEKLDENEINTINMFKNFYNINNSILKYFVNPINILNFFNHETLMLLKSLNIDGDFEHSYTTGHKDFNTFINVLLHILKEKGLFIFNTKNELALNYDDTNWKNQALELIKTTNFIQSFHKNNVVSAMKNIRNDWGFLRNINDGYGVIYDKKYLIDPMFDSELFMLFDLYIKFKKEIEIRDFEVEQIFINLFKSLNNEEKVKFKIVQNILDWLPCNYFICEEHLKNWIVKKIYSESILLDNRYQTENYFVLGMGMKDGTRMSSSRGTAILIKDLINKYGHIKARLIILLTGGHPSKIYNYDASIIDFSEKIINDFYNYFTYLLLIKNNEIESDTNLNNTIDTDGLNQKIENYIKSGYYRQAIIEMLVNIPKQYKLIDHKSSLYLIKFYDKYLNKILLPNFLNNYKYDI